MNKPIDVISVIKDSMQEVIDENNLREFNGLMMEDLFRVYSANFCSIMLTFFPWANVVISNNYLECAVLIDDVVYNSYGEVIKDGYHVCNEEELNHITKGLNHLSLVTFEKLKEKVNDAYLPVSKTYRLIKQTSHKT